MLDKFRSGYEAYVKAWGRLPSPADRPPLLDSSVAATVSYIDPRVVTTGRDGLEQLMTAQRQSSPDVYFSIDSWQAHHSQAMAEWTAVKDGKNFIMGTDVVLFDAEGRMAAVHSFFHPIDENGDKIKPEPTTS